MSEKTINSIALRTPELSVNTIPEKIESLQMLRGVAVLMVLAYHMGTYEAKACTDPLLGHFAKIGAAGVDIFFVISGFVMIMISNRAKNSEDRPGNFLLHRAVRIYPIYWFYTSIALTVFYFHPSLVRRDGGIGETSLLRSILLFPDRGAPIIGQGWTLIHEMYFYVGFTLILTGGRKYRKKLLLLWAGILSLICYVLPTSWFGSSISSNVFLKLVFNPLTFEFLGGCMLAYVIARNWTRWAKTIFILGVCLLLISPTTMYWVGATSQELFFGIPALLIVYGAVAMERNFGFTGPRFLRVIGDASYSIYLSHIFCLSASVLVWKSFKWVGVMDNLVILAMMVVVSLAAGIFSYRFIERPSQRFFRNLLNKKNRLRTTP
jgi:exopolysaccharide production protein ExoZ